MIAAALSPEIFRLIGPAYRGDWPIFTALLGYALLLGVAPLISLACNFLGGARGRLPIAALCIGVNLGLDLVLIPSYGAYGAAVSTTVAFLLYVLGHLRLANRILGPAPRRRFNASISRATVAAIVAMVVARVSVQPLSFLGWVGAGLAGLAALVAYLAIMQPVVGPALRWRPVAEPSEFEVRQEP